MTTPPPGRPVFPADPFGVAAAAACLARGGVVAVPTDTVVGLAVGVGVPDPASRLAAVKGRPLDRPVILMAEGAAALSPYVRWTEGAQRFAERHWPGPLTLILAATELGLRLGGPGTIGVRVPASPLLLSLLGTTGPLATTSANRHGEPPAATVAAALLALPLVDAALSEPEPARQGAGTPSSILDCTAERPVLLRVGALDAEALGLEGPGRGRGGAGSERRGPGR